jgi:hypothetical protein
MTSGAIWLRIGTLKIDAEIHSGDAMPIVFALNPSDGLPLYMQLINVIKTAIAEENYNLVTYLRNVNSGKRWR